MDGDTFNPRDNKHLPNNDPPSTDSLCREEQTALDIKAIELHIRDLDGQYQQLRCDFARELESLNTMIGNHVEYRRRLEALRLKTKWVALERLRYGCFPHPPK